jgi:hypothetical protein
VLASVFNLVGSQDFSLVQLTIEMPQKKRALAIRRRQGSKMRLRFRQDLQQTMPRRPQSKHQGRATEEVRQGTWRLQIQASQAYKGRPWQLRIRQERKEVPSMCIRGRIHRQLSRVPKTSVVLCGSEHENGRGQNKALNIHAALFLRKIRSGSCFL